MASRHMLQYDSLDLLIYIVYTLVNIYNSLQENTSSLQTKLFVCDTQNHFHVTQASQISI